MTRRTSARVAGVAFLVYIVAGVASLALDGRARRGTGFAEQMAALAAHATQLRVAVLLGVVAGGCALALAASLYALTRDEDPALAALGLACRVVEGAFGFLPISSLGLLWLATAPRASDAATAQSLGALLERIGDVQSTAAAILFSVGSTAFSWLLLRGRMVPVPMARLGVAASVLLVVGLPLRLAGFVGGAAFMSTWAPMLVFELALASWLIVKGAAAPPPRRA